MSTTRLRRLTYEPAPVKDTALYRAALRLIEDLEEENAYLRGRLGLTLTDHVRTNPDAPTRRIA